MGLHMFSRIFEERCIARGYHEHKGVAPRSFFFIDSVVPKQVVDACMGKDGAHLRQAARVMIVL